MAKFSSATSRYQRDQRIARAGTVVVIIVAAAMSAWIHHRWSVEPTDPPESDATASAMPTPMQVREWLNESEPTINTLVGARNNIAAAAGHRDIAGTGVACRAATGAVADMHRHLPSPEPVLNDTLQLAIVNYEVGLPYCISASQTHDGDGMQRAATYISQGDTAMRIVLDMLGGRSDTQPRELGVLIV